MSDLIACDTHGEQHIAYVCGHLVEGSAGLGFNRGDPTEENPFPDAWCDECNLIHQANGGWSDKTEGLVTIEILCSACYERSRIRNTRTEVSFEDLSDFRWKCDSGEEWHSGPCLDSVRTSPPTGASNMKKAVSQAEQISPPHSTSIAFRKLISTKTSASSTVTTSSAE